MLALLGASAVGLGAFGAHALRDVLTPASLEIWRTAVQYHFWHTLAFALAAMIRTSRSIARAAMWLLAIGVLLFCGSLYALALGAPRWAGAITPVGGVAFILGWIALGTALVRREK
ncbi:MAG TPA: DUF423 domain-containing protein [Rhodanobacteraceae bacterium]|nr:DUF423 domain-containing protein [Rhodanobacteraceae bacterium]